MGGRCLQEISEISEHQAPTGLTGRGLVGRSRPVPSVRSGCSCRRRSLLPLNWRSLTSSPLTASYLSGSCRGIVWPQLRSASARRTWSSRRGDADERAIARLGGWCWVLDASATRAALHYCAELPPPRGAPRAAGHLLDALHGGEVTSEEDGAAHVLVRREPHVSA